MQDHLGLLERSLLTNVPQELKELEVPRQVGFADTAKHLQLVLELRKQALRPIFMNLAAYHASTPLQTPIN
jgi:hypothetical protein